MKKSTKGEVVLSSCQIHATRLNKLEYHRLQRNINLLKDDLQEDLARINRQEQGLKLHFKNIVRVVKPNRPYQLWKQAHAYEIAQDQAKELIESFKRKEKLRTISRQQTTLSATEYSSEPLRPLLLLLEDPNKKPIDPIINISQNFLRTKSSPINRNVVNPHRINPILNMLDGPPLSSNNISQQQQLSTSHRVNPILTMLNGRPASSNTCRSQQYDSASFHSLSSTGTLGSRKLVQGKYITAHKKSDLDALYRMALQNQTAYKSIESTVIEDRKLHDKEFASRHRALLGSMRSASTTN